MSKYREIFDARQKQAVDVRFACEIQQMQELGFTDQFYGAEITFPLSAAIMFPFVLYSRFVLRDLVTLTPLLGVVALNPYFIHKDVYCYSVIDSRGPIYTTMFTDGAILRTSSFPSRLVRSWPKHKLIRYVPQHKKNEAAWELHQTVVAQWGDEGHETLSLHTVADALDVERRVDEIDSGSTPTIWPGSHQKTKSALN